MRRLDPISLLSLIRRQAVHLPRALRLIAAASGPLLPIWFILLFVAGLLPVATVHLTRDVVDSLADRQWQALLLPAAALGLVLLLNEMTAAVRRWLGGLQAEKVGDDLAERIQERALGVSLEHYDDAAFYDRLHRARFHAQQHPAALLESGGSLLQNGLTLVAMGAVLIPFGLAWPVLLVASSLPGIYVALKVRLEDYAWRRRTTERRRRVHYLDQLMSTREAAAELRTLDLGGLLRGQYREMRGRLREEKRTLMGRRVVLEVTAAAAALMVAAAALWWMIGRLRAGEATLGELALFAQAFYQGQRMMRALLENAGDLYSHLFDLGDFFAFLDLKLVDGRSSQDASLAAGRKAAMPPAIRCKGLRFTYESSETPALRGLDLNLEGGRLHALIGPNGAGKSTLIKILSGLLEPQAGTITVDGQDLSEIDRREWRRQLAVMFQEPVRFQMSLLENIRFGDLAEDPSFDAIQRAAHDAGLEALISSLENGYETRLGAWFRDGRELSSGQWQRIALARSCLRRASLWMLDEPTSAVDVWSERAFFERLRPLVEERTVILITHRPSAARHADLIHVVEGGRVVESGSPEELIASGGRYAAMWPQE